MLLGSMGPLKCKDLSETQDSGTPHCGHCPSRLAPVGLELVKARPTWAPGPAILPAVLTCGPQGRSAFKCKRSRWHQCRTDVTRECPSGTCLMSLPSTVSLSTVPRSHPAANSVFPFSPCCCHWTLIVLHRFIFLLKKETSFQKQRVSVQATLCSYSPTCFACYNEMELGVGAAAFRDCPSSAVRRVTQGRRPSNRMLSAPCLSTKLSGMLTAHGLSTWNDEALRGHAGKP